MGNLVPIVAQVETSQGEVLVTINLNLNVKVDQDGLISVEGKVDNPPKSVKLDNNVKFEKPDIFDNNEIIDFGKKV